MKWIKYQIVCNEEEQILLDKKIGYSEENLIIAETEAYNGVYEIIEDDEIIEVKPLEIELGGTGASNVDEVLKNLGLSDKLNIEIITYVGTGKGGIDNPCNITYSFAPKIVQMLGFIKANGEQKSIHYATAARAMYNIIFCDKLTTEYVDDAGFSSGTSTRSAKKSADGKTISWYSTYPTEQFNDEGETYYVLAIG